ncbi:MAG: LPS export ABC transporter periplasmic protein LptC, partial [Sphingopyxis sp.]
GEISFLLSKDAIDVSPQRLQVTQARYRGSDSLGRPFIIAADSAVQISAADPVVRMQGLTARITMADGPAALRTQAGRYDPTTETVRADGPITFTAADGFSLSTGDVAIDLKARALNSGRGVTGALPIGRFSAARIDANLETRIVRLSGNARLRINQGVLR